VAEVISNTGTVLTVRGNWTTLPTTSTYTVRSPRGLALTPEAIVASIPAEEIAWGGVSPGFAQRVPEVYVPWGWDQQVQRLQYEYRAFNGPALLNLGIARIDAVSILSTDLGQWITSDGGTIVGPTSTAARLVAVRQATLFGGGLLQWDFQTTYEYPELEEGDLIAVPTSWFVANNPITSTAVSGWLMAVGKVIGTDLSGKRFKLWIRRWNDLIPASEGILRDGFRGLSSSALNGQGSTIPYGVPPNVLTSRWGGIGAGQMWIAFKWSTFNLIRADGSTLAVPAPPAALPGPFLGDVAGGTRGALTLYARIGLVKNNELCAISGEASTAVGANRLLTITSPAAVAGYDGWMPMVASATNTEYIQATGISPNAGPLAFGTDYQEATGHFTTVDSQYDNTWWPGALVLWGMNPSITTYWYPFYDIGPSLVRVAPFGGGSAVTAPDAPSASKQVGDGRYPLSVGAFTVAIGAGGGGGGGTSGGGRFT
jgi:hypothetical protein